VALSQSCYTPPNKRDLSAGHAVASTLDYSDPLLNRRQILLFGLIDARAAQSTIQRLLYLDGKSHDPIDLYLHTPGGEIKHALAIEQTMRLLRSPVNTYAFSECNSGGALLLAGGTGKRRAFRGGIVVIHGITIHGKPPAELRDLVNNSYTQFWQDRSRLPDSWLPLPPGILHFLSAEQALEYGLVDEIVDR
jgi:ATP-dependent Clp protease protease subunit